MKLVRRALALAGILAPLCLLAAAFADDRYEWTD
jgi:hypothetical protein